MSRAAAKAPSTQRRRRAAGGSRGSQAEPEALSRQVYRLLSDRQFHSGQRLAEFCSVSRGAVWKAVDRLRALGVAVHAVANRGYRLPIATELLDAAQIVAHLPPPVAAQLRRGEARWQTDSTNSELLQRAAVAPGQFDFLTAEYQSAGRGRRARRWLAPPGGAICLSLSWSFASMPANIGALSLAIGVCVLRALDGVGVPGVGLKWPNDLVAQTRKLGGILTELRAEADGPVWVVVGIGLNVALGERLTDELRTMGAHSVDLAELGIEQCDRNRLAAAVIAECVAGLQRFERASFNGFIQDWRAADALAGKAIVVNTGESLIAGHARGIDVAGALCVQTRDGLRRFATGEVSVRETG